MSHAFQNSPHLMILRDRARQMHAVRAFFAKRQICEVDTPLLSRGAALDTHIDLFFTKDEKGERRYLHSSPEFAMKRLLSQGMEDIYQLSHVYRLGEISQKHQPEFTMIEWYRVGAAFDAFMDETIDLMRELLGPLSKNTLTYKQAFKRYTGLDPFAASSLDLVSYLKSQNVHPFMQENLSEADARDNLLNQILGLFIEPNLGWDDTKQHAQLTILSHYPASQAALARTISQDGNRVAERFEIYSQGIELANGYHELADADEQKVRFTETNQQRIALGKEPLPIDLFFLEALQSGLPDSCGVAVGFDRLMMLRHQKTSILDVLPFHWDNI